MKFVKLTSNYYLDPAVAAELSDAGEVAFTRSIAYCGNAESGGFISEAVLSGFVRKYTPARGRKVAAELVAARLWVEVPGGWRLRTWQKQQEELERLLARRRNDAERQQRRRSKTSESRDESRDTEPALSRDSHVTPFACAPSREEKRGRQELLTLVCRQLGSDARDLDDDDRAGLWKVWAEVAGGGNPIPDDDLAAELRSWLMRNATTTLTDPAAALLGWLRKSASRRTSAPSGCASCNRGWLPDDVESGRPVPCPDCRPHLRPVPDDTRSAS